VRKGKIAVNYLRINRPSFSPPRRGKKSGKKKGRGEKRRNGSLVLWQRTVWMNRKLNTSGMKRARKIGGKKRGGKERKRAPGKKRERGERSPRAPPNLCMAWSAAVCS